MTYLLAIDGAFPAGKFDSLPDDWPKDTLFIGAISNDDGDSYTWDIYYSRKLDRFGYISRVMMNYFGPHWRGKEFKNFSDEMVKIIAAWENRGAPSNRSNYKSRFNRLQT